MLYAFACYHDEPRVLDLTLAVSSFRICFFYEGSPTERLLGNILCQSFHFLPMHQTILMVLMSPRKTFEMMKFVNGHGEWIHDHEAYRDSVCCVSRPCTFRSHQKKAQLDFLIGFLHHWHLFLLPRLCNVRPVHLLRRKSTRRIMSWLRTVCNWPNYQSHGNRRFVPFSHENDSVGAHRVR